MGNSVWNSRIPKVNSRILGNSRLGILEFPNSRSCWEFALAQYKQRLQDFIAIFALRAAALAMERRSGSVRRNFTIAFGALANKSK